MTQRRICGLVEWIAAASLSCAVVLPVAAQPPWNVRPVGRIGGWCRMVEVAGRYAYLAEGGNLTILDVSNPSSPFLVGHFSFGDFYINDIELKDGLAYAAGGWSWMGKYGLQVVDVRNPRSPSVLGFCPTPAPATGVCLSDGLAYLSIAYGFGYNPAGGFQIIDISDPSSPTLKGPFFALPFIAWDVYTTGGIAYVACDNGLHILDVRNPLVARHLALYDQYYCNAVLVSGGLAYTATDGGLEILDITSPTAPTFRGGMGSFQSSGLFMSNGLVFLAEFSPSGLRIVDVTNPSSATLRGSFDTQGFSHDVAVSSGTAYLADGPGGLSILDVTNPSSPTLRATYDTLSDASDVWVEGGVAYVANGIRGLKTVDVANPQSPTILGTLDTLGPTHKICLSAARAYVCGSSGHTVGTLRSIFQIVDVTTPSLPRSLGSFEMPGRYMEELIVSGGLAYIAAYNTLEIVDISDPSSPTLRGTFHAQTCASDVFVSGNLAYVADYSRLQIVDVSDPTSPVLRSFFGGSGWWRIYDVFLSNGVAYITCRRETGGVYADFACIDVTNPDSPRLLGTYGIPLLGDHKGLYVSNGFAYLPMYGLRVLDVRNPSSPTLCGFYPARSTFVFPHDVFACDDLIYLADTAGLQIFQFTGSLTDASHWPLYR